MDYYEEVSSTLVKVILEETLTEMRQLLPDAEKHTIVVLDAMQMFKKWSFLPNETFDDVQARYRRNLCWDTPVDTKSVYFIIM